MFDIDESTVNAEPAVNVEPQQTEPNTQPESVPGEVATPQEDKKVQSAEDNARFAAIRREAEAKAKDAVIAEMGYSYNGKPITTYAEYQNALQEQQRQQEVQQQAELYKANPELVAYIKSLEDKVNNMENMTKEQKEAAEREAFQTKIKTDVTEVLKVAEKEGIKVTEEDLLKTMIDEGISDPRKAYKLMKPDLNIEEVKQKAITEYVEKLKKGYKPVEGGGTAPVVVQEPAKTFDEARKRAIEIMKGSKQFN